MHICTVTIALHTNILLISHFAPFFSLFSIYKTNSSIFFPSSSSSSSDTHKHTHTHGHTNRPNIAKSTQTHHPHRSNTTKSNTLQNQPRTHHKINQKSNTPTHGHTNRDRESIFVSLWLWVGAWKGRLKQISVDQCLW